MWRVPAVVLALASPLAACQFDAPIDRMPVDAPVVDAIDAPPPCTPDTIVCDDAQGVYVECDATGTVVRQMTCPLGCAPDVEKCLDIDPHNGLAMYLDMAESAPDLVLTGPARIDTNLGVIIDQGITLAVPTAYIEGPGLRVFWVRSLTVDGAVAVSPSTSPQAPFAIVAAGEITVRGFIDISADGAAPGPGGQSAAFAQSGVLECAGEDGYAFAAGSNYSSGGGGGGGASIGGAGGQGRQSERPLGSPIDVAVEPLLGGCGGGATVVGTRRAAGGGGGGALQLVSRTRIVFRDSGGIDASGGGGQAGSTNIGGAGGGAGGKLLLEAPQVVFDGTGVVLSTKGGGGAGSSFSQAGGAGADGNISPSPAPGGPSSDEGIGGAGAVGSPQATGMALAGSTSLGNNAGGGGGGASGTLAVFTRGGVIDPLNGAALRSSTIVRTVRSRLTPP